MFFITKELSEKKIKRSRLAKNVFKKKTEQTQKLYLKTKY